MEKTTFDEIQKINSRDIVLFGSGNIAKKTLRRLESGEVSFIADNSLDLQGEDYNGFPVRSPDEITDEHFVIITSTAISDISHQLSSMGLEEMEDFVVSPVLNDRIRISELEALKTEFFFTSGAIIGGEQYGKHGSNKYGGGLFKCTVDGLDYTHERIYKGPSYGSCRIGERILFIDTDRGLMEYDTTEKEFENLCEFPKGARAHGISFSKEKNKYYVACSHRDSVLELDENYEIERELMISEKIERTNKPMHHCNDVLVLGDSVYVSMFSSSGNWKRDRFDGCIAEFSLATGERGRDLHCDLWMPHNIDYINGSIHVLDSLTGELRFNNLTVQGEFQAFSRGLGYSDGLYYIGQSKNRNHSKILGVSNNISIDCGVVVFDPELKISRFLHFPHVGGIHSITV